MVGMPAMAGMTVVPAVTGVAWVAGLVFIHGWSVAGVIELFLGVMVLVALHP